jgi:hypothetical protein
MMVVVLEGGPLLRKEMAACDYIIEDGVTRQVRTDWRRISRLGHDAPQWKKTTKAPIQSNPPQFLVYLVIQGVVEHQWHGTPPGPTFCVKMMAHKTDLICFGRSYVFVNDPLASCFA